MKKIAIIAGEVSGDILGSRLIEALKAQRDDLQFEGIGGEEMQKAGCDCLYPMERLAVMGFAEVFGRLFELLKIRKQLINRWLENPPDLFIGIDAPDFNLKLEAALHKAGIPAVHYVSPSVWAWRSDRVKKMQGNLDLMLTLFPFEADFYHQHDIPAEFVGHPLADEIPLHNDQNAARQTLLQSTSFDAEKPILAVLPGSRGGEIKRLAEPFLQAAQRFQQTHPHWQLLVPFANDNTMQQFEQIKQDIAPDLSMNLVNGHSRTVMAAADLVLIASGTAVLEGMLIGRPMVAAYKVAPLTMAIIRLFKMMRVKHYTLPNNLANEVLVPEIMQDDLNADNLHQALLDLLNETDEQKNYRLRRFNEIHQQLRLGASEQAARLLLEKGFLD